MIVKTQGFARPMAPQNSSIQRRLVLSLPLTCLLVSTPGTSFAQETYGLRQRVPMTTSRVIGTPDPAPPFRARRLFPNLKFNEPVHIIREPGTSRLLVTEREGRIYAIPDDQQVRAPTLLIDVGRECYSLCFDPHYMSNGNIYVFSNAMIDGAKRNRISRYTMTTAPSQSGKPDPASELVILEWQSNGHNGHFLQFGPDGMLWISAGDGTSGMDPQWDGQNISNLRGTMIRIDVNGATNERPYSIPENNPFVGNENARPEIWAFGFRNPYRFAFDSTNQLWVADIGQDVWEMIYRVNRGGNYGWSVMEGPDPLNATRPRGPAPIEPPVVAHPHSEMRSITGGFFYRGQRYPQLRGSYLYGDYDTRRMFAMRYDDQRHAIASQQEIAATGYRIISLGEDHDNEILILAYTGEILTLDPTPKDETPHADFPRRLSETGLFDDLRQHRAAAGVIEYSVNSPLWSDGAMKDRMMAIPGLAKVGYQPHRAWDFPANSVLIKTFSLPSEAGSPLASRRVETRLLHRQPQGEWVGYSYRWNEAQTDADLVPAEGLDQAFEMDDSSVEGGKRQQVWHFPSRAECMVCHTREARYLLGLTTLQMNRNHKYGEIVDNQLRTLDHIGLFEKSLPSDQDSRPALPAPDDPNQPLESRVRSYLHTNCAHCHVTNGGGNAQLELEYTKPMDKTGLLAIPRQGTFGIEEAKLIAPGHPERSVLLQRISHRDKGKMPPLASSRVDHSAVRLLTEWITKMDSPR